MSDAHRDFLDTRTFASLDGLRAFAVVAVVWHHTFPKPALFDGMTRGFLGVDLFFLISGFLIVTLLLRERRRTSTISLRGFYARRFLRIFPLYYGVLAFAAVTAFARHSPEAQHMRADLPWALVYLSNWTAMTSLLDITWSLSAEEQFYLVWPPLERIASAMGRAGRLVVRVLLAGALVATGALQLLHAPLHLDGLPPFLWQASFFPILLGVALAHVLDDARAFAVLQRLVAFRGAPVVYALLVLALVLGLDGDIAGLPRMGIHFAMLFFLASCVIKPFHALRPVFTWKPIARVGVLSYGVYLLHMLARHVAAKLIGDESAWLFPLTLALVLVIAEVSYRFYESKFLELKQRFVSA